jgi:two-component system chemotaxis response regulator CheY
MLLYVSRKYKKKFYMKILIVDDNANNRMILNLLLQDYGTENKNGPHEIEECANGHEAVMAVEKTRYDLILMDIMMPIMDGIEATQKIRAIDKEVMIIAVSAVDDERKKDEILRNGAEDYIHKPINSQQLFSRLDNYLSIVPLRHKDIVLKNTKAINLYTQDVFHRQTIFYVENEEALAEFWEYYLLNSEDLKLDKLCDVVRAVFSLGDAIVKTNAKPWIIVEANNDALYFTLNKLDMIDSRDLGLMMAKNKEVEEYKHNDEKISFRLKKLPVNSQACDVNLSAQVHVTVPQEKEAVHEAKNLDEVSVSDIQIKKTDAGKYQVYNYMDPEDLHEVEELLDDLSSLMLMLGSSDLESSEIDQISNFLAELGKNMSIYTESYAIGMSLSNLSQVIATNSARFQEIAAELSTLSSAFTSDLQSWLKMTFYKGAPSVDFMNDTIIVNCETIISMLSADDSDPNNADLDDIFDF